MEEEKGSDIFPIRTKVAAWWMKIIGSSILAIILIGTGFYGFLCLRNFELCIGIFMMLLLGILLIPAGGISFFLGSKILKKEKSAWVVSIIILFIGIISCAGGFTYYYSKEGLLGSRFFHISARPYHGIYSWNFFILILLLIPFFLLLSDRKNFWKIAS